MKNPMKLYVTTATGQIVNLGKQHKELYEHLLDEFFKDDVATKGLASLNQNARDNNYYPMNLNYKFKNSFNKLSTRVLVKRPIENKQIVKDVIRVCSPSSTIAFIELTLNKRDENTSN